jgi:hypothetical protein
MSLDMVTLIVMCVAWLASAASLVASWIPKPKPRAVAIRWRSAGFLVMFSGSIVSQVGRMLRWYESQLIIDSLTLIFGLVGIGCLVVGAVKGWSGRTAGGTRVEPRGSGT